MKLIIFLIAFCSTFVITSCSQKKDATTTDDPGNIEGKSTYENPADDKVYKTEGEWKKYTPETPGEKGGPVELKQIILLTSDAEMEKAIDVNHLSDFIKQAEHLIEKEMNNTDKIGEMLIQITLDKEGVSAVQISLAEDVDKEKVQTVYDDLLKISGYSTQQDSVVFQLHYTMNKE